MTSRIRAALSAFLVGCAGLALLGGAAQADSGTFALEIVAAQLNAPRGIDVTADGTVYVAEAGRGGRNCETLGEGSPSEGVYCFGGTGAVTRIRDGRQTRVVTGLPSNAVEDGSAAIGPHDVEVTKGGRFLIAMGGEGGLEQRREQAEVFGKARLLGTLLAAHDGDVHKLRDITRLETRINPDGGPSDSDGINGNPWAVLRDGRASIMTDAGGNALWRFRPGRKAQVLATFRGSRMTNPFDGSQMRAQSVPTGLAEGPDGAYYVGELTGFPFEKGKARVWRVVPGEEPTVFARGFTNIISIAFDSSGRLLVLELARDGLLSVEGPESPAPGRLVRVNADGSKQTIVGKGLRLPTGMAVSPAGEIYISNDGLEPGVGTVVKVNR